MKNDSYEAIADRNRRRAWQVVDELNLVKIWEAAGARVNSVGSLATGLLAKHLDIDFHIYSEPPLLPSGCAAMARIAENASVRRIECVNLLHTDEKCVEWHAWYEDRDGELWQFGLRRLFRALRPTAAKGADAGNAAGRPAAQVRDSRPRENLRSGNLPRGRAGRGPDPYRAGALESGASADRHLGMDALRAERADEKPLRRTVAAARSRRSRKQAKNLTKRTVERSKIAVSDAGLHLQRRILLPLGFVIQHETAFSKTIEPIWQHLTH